jgi:hypothetical protein
MRRRGPDPPVDRLDLAVHGTGKEMIADDLLRIVFLDRLPTIWSVDPTGIGAAWLSGLLDRAPPITWLHRRDQRVG